MSSTIKPKSPLNIFDRKTKRQQKDCAARNPDVAIYDYLKDEFGFRLADRVLDVKRSFPVVIELGAGRGCVTKHLTDVSIVCSVCRSEVLMV